MTIEKLPSGKYRISEMVGGVRYRKTVNFRPKQAEARRIIAELVETGETSVERMTVRQAIERYMEARRAVLSPSTLYYYKRYLRQLPEGILSRQISSVTDDDLQRVISTLSAGRKPKSVKNIFGLLSATMGYFRPKFIINVKFPEAARVEPYIPTDRDIKILMMAISGSKYEIPIKLAACGLRRSEICALTADDIVGDTVTVNKSKVISGDGGRDFVVKAGGKTVESTRTVRIPEALADQIKKQGYVYKGNPDSINPYLNRTLKRLGIPHFSLHKLRHYYASRSHSLGVPDVYILKSGGWRTDNVMKSVYRHALKDQAEKMEAQIIAHMGKLLK